MYVGALALLIEGRRSKGRRSALSSLTKDRYYPNLLRLFLCRPQSLFQTLYLSIQSLR